MNTSNKQEKPITKIYCLSILSRKNKLVHNLMADCILPESYWKESLYEKKIGSIYHCDYNMDSYDKFNRLSSIHLKPVIINKLNMHKCNELSICYAKGAVCSKCFDFNSDYNSNNIPWDIIREFKKISSRDQLAKFIQKSRKIAVQVKAYKCELCIKEEQEALKLKQIQEREQILIEQMQRQLQESKKPNNFDLEYRRKKAESHLYLMKCNRTGFYKIGKSSNPKHREKTLQSETPSIHMVAVFDNQGNIEREWHSHFAKHRIRGEWFELSKVQVLFMCSTIRKNQMQLT